MWPLTRLCLKVELLPGAASCGGTRTCLNDAAVFAAGVIHDVVSPFHVLHEYLTLSILQSAVQEMPGDGGGCCSGRGGSFRS